jgi:hypothetical protein
MVGADPCWACAQQWVSLAIIDPASLRLACIAHKSLEIFERCRLRQQNPAATPDNSAAFWREEFQGSLFRFILL